VHKHPDVADRIHKVADEDPAHRKIFVHGLGWDTNTETLSNAFKQYGEIEDCKAVCDKVSGKSKGYGFILFKTRGGARKALKQPQKKIGNRMTACQLASMFPVAQPSATAAASTTPLSEYAQRKIYVSNVGAELDPQKLLMFFSKYGEIEEGPLGLDKMTGKPKGFCLFTYKTVESAKRALEEPHKNFEGHTLHCQKAIDGPKPKKSHPHQLQYQHQHHQLQYQPHQNPHNAQFQRNENPALVGGAAAAAPGHLMAPPTGAGIGLNQGAAAAAQALNPALGQAIAALFASQGAGLGLTNLLGTLASAAAANPGVPAAGHGTQGAYSNQSNISPGLIGGYGNQGGMQVGYPNLQTQGGSGRGQHGVVQYGGVNPYTGQ
jgi:heterogeneous nuclear ribonucleoprotein A1/A3